VVTQTLMADPGNTGTWQEYVGGWADWVAQRGIAGSSGAVARALRSRAPKRSTLQAHAETRRGATSGAKLSFAERRELAALPDELEALEREQHALTERMCRADYHKGSVEAIKADRKRAEEVEHALARKFERWGELDARNGRQPQD
jgi:ATP-binding cassette subfamily F protein uup